MEKECIISRLSESIKTTSRIDNELFTEYNVKRGLRNEDHSGVLVGLTKIGNVVGYEKLPEGGLKAIPGRLIYRGIDVEDLVRGILAENGSASKKPHSYCYPATFPTKKNWPLSATWCTSACR